MEVDGVDVDGFIGADGIIAGAIVEDFDLLLCD